jgi:hypothetical protein
MAGQFDPGSVGYRRYPGFGVFANSSIRLHRRAKGGAMREVGVCGNYRMDRVLAGPHRYLERLCRSGP